MADVIRLPQNGKLNKTRTRDRANDRSGMFAPASPPDTAQAISRSRHGWQPCRRHHHITRPSNSRRCATVMAQAEPAQTPPSRGGIPAGSSQSAARDRAECYCGCYVHIPDVLAQAVKEAEERPLRAVIIVGDAFHDDPDDLDKAAISANRLRRAGTRVFLMQLGDDLSTARKLQYLARVSGGAYFRFDPRTQERQFSEMWKAMSVYAAGGEEAVKTTGGQAATVLLQHLQQEPMPIIEERARVWVDPDIKE